MPGMVPSLSRVLPLPISTVPTANVPLLDRATSTFVRVVMAALSETAPPRETTSLDVCEPLVSIHEVSPEASIRLPTPRAEILAAPPGTFVTALMSTKPPDRALIDKVPLRVPPLMLVKEGKLNRLPSPMASKWLSSSLELLYVCSAGRTRLWPPVTLMLTPVIVIRSSSLTVPPPQKSSDEAFESFTSIQLTKADRSTSLPCCCALV